MLEVVTLGRDNDADLVISSAASVESVRLDPDLRAALRERARRAGRTSSDVIRAALRKYLRAS